MVDYRIKEKFYNTVYELSIFNENNDDLVNKTIELLNNKIDNDDFSLSENEKDMIIDSYNNLNM